MLTENGGNTEHPPRVVLSISGDVDAARQAELLTTFARNAEHDTVVADLSEVTFIDSSGLRLLIEEHRRRDDRGHRLLLRRPSAVVLRLLDITKLTGYFSIEPF